MGRRHVEASGNLSRVLLSDLLQTLESSGSTGEARFRTNLGSATIWFRGGRLIDAVMGNAHAEAAIYRLLGATEGTFEIEHVAVERLQVINESALALAGRRKRRAEEWQNLVQYAPPLESVLRVDAERLGAERERLAEVDRELLRLIDGRRTIFELIDESGFDAVAVLERVVEFIRAGLLKGAAVRTPPPLARDEDDEAASVPPITERLYSLAKDLLEEEPSLSAAPPEKASLGLRGVEGPRRRGTAVGIGPVKGPPIRPSPMFAVDGRPPEAPEPSPERTEAGEAPAADAEAAASHPGEAETEEDPRSTAEATNEEPPVSSRLLAPEPVTAERALLGRYEVLSRIARGGMGTVYLCRITGEGGFRRLFALKVLRRHLARYSKAAQMFLSEARIAARIHHPNVVGIVDIGTSDGQPYLVMDYVEGGSLQEIFRRHPENRPPELVVPILLDALNGLEAAHTLVDDDGASLGLVHCDVSPHNMLIGIDGSCRLSDFGIAKAMGAMSPQAFEMTRGKPAYLSPEQAAAKPYDHRADIFSAGIVLYNALTGARLFEGSSVAETLENVHKQPIEPPSKVGLRPPDCFDAVCLKALERDPDRRYQSAEEMLTELRRVAMQHDLLATPGAVARWVRDTFGAELQLRRLAYLDASRRARAAGEQSANRALPELDRKSDAGPAPREADALPPSDPPPSEDVSRTIVLPKPNRRRVVVVVASAVALIAAAVAAAWPKQVGRMFVVEGGAEKGEEGPSGVDGGAE